MKISTVNFLIDPREIHSVRSFTRNYYLKRVEINYHQKKKVEQNKFRKYIKPSLIGQQVIYQ